MLPRTGIIWGGERKGGDIQAIAGFAKKGGPADAYHAAILDQIPSKRIR